MDLSENKTNGIGKELIDEINTGLADSGNADIHAAAAGIRSSVGVDSYTFVVDSNAALLAWANNTAGNDYTHVLIKKGDWTSNTGVNLTDTGTVAVVGEGGSIMYFNGVSVTSGLYYSNIPSPGGYHHWMQGVTVCTVHNSHTGSRTCFKNCINMVNCAVVYPSTSGVLSGFYNCRNLVNCRGEITGTIEGADFNLCENLTNCSAYGNATVIGFLSCTDLMGCNGKSFQDCRRMLMCKPNSSSTGTLYSGCYMHATGTADPVGDTAAGGWNRS